jgi:hypothetical protein
LRIAKGRVPYATFVMALILVPPSYGYGQGPTPADPYDLKSIGMPKRAEKRPIVAPSTAPAGFEDCGGGVYYTDMEVPVSKKQSRKARIVVAIFAPDINSPLPDFSGSVESSSPKAKPITVPPTGYGALTFEWPPQLRVEQMVRLQRSVLINGHSTEIRLELPAEMNLQESSNSSPSISWNLDRFVAGTRAPVILGKLISPGDPLLLHVFFAKGTKKCVER